MAEPDSNSPWMTSQQAADYLKVDIRTICAWAREGRVPHSRSDDRANGRLLFNKASLDRWLLSREQGGES